MATCDAERRRGLGSIMAMLKMSVVNAARGRSTTQITRATRKPLSQTSADE